MPFILQWTTAVEMNSRIKYKHSNFTAEVIDTSQQ